MKDNEIINALDILDKFDFFGGQRAGRELWFDKPVDIQNKDIGDFLRDLDFLRHFIKRQQAEIERLEKVKTLGDDLIEQLRITVNNRTEENKSLELDLAAMRCAANSYKLHYGNMKAEIVREFADRLKNEIEIRPTYSKEQNEYVNFLIDNLVKEMESENNDGP